MWFCGEHVKRITMYIGDEKSLAIRRRGLHNCRVRRLGGHRDPIVDTEEAMRRCTSRLPPLSHSRVYPGRDTRGETNRFEVRSFTEKTQNRFSKSVGLAAHFISRRRTGPTT